MFGIERQLFTFSTSTHDQMSRIGCVLGMGERARAEFCTPPLLYERHRETVSTTHIQRQRQIDIDGLCSLLLPLSSKSFAEILAVA